MGPCLTVLVTTKIQGNTFLYTCQQSETPNNEWPIKHASTFLDTNNKVARLEKTHTLGYGILVDSNLSIPALEDRFKQPVFAVIDFETYQSKFQGFEKNIKEVLKALIEKKQIVQLWKKENLITRIGVAKDLALGNDNSLAAIGLCNFQEDAFTKSSRTSFFSYNKPTAFSVHKLDAKLLQLDEDEYTRFIDGFKNAIGKLEVFEYVSLNATGEESRPTSPPPALTPAAIKAAKHTVQDSTQGCCVLL